MRVNKFVALSTGLSRRKADQLIAQNKVFINNKPALNGQIVSSDDIVKLNKNALELPTTKTIIFNKPTGFVCSRDGQGSKTIYDILPAEFQKLKYVGRLDKNSSGLLLLTNDGDLANTLTHPSHKKAKTYIVSISPKLNQNHIQELRKGIMLDDGISKFTLLPLNGSWQVTIFEGRNRQIRRTFKALGYKVTSLHRINFGDYGLDDLKIGQFKIIS